MSSPAVCDSKSPREMATDLNLQGNGHHSDTLTHFACIKSWHTTRAQMHPQFALIPTHAHTALPSEVVCMCVCFCPSQTHFCFLVCVYKLFSVPRAPLAVSDRFGPSASFVSLSVLLASSGVQRLPVYSWRIAQKQRGSRLPGRTTSGGIAKNARVEIKYLNLLCSVHPNPHLNKRLSHPLYIKIHQPPLQLDLEC